MDTGLTPNPIYIYLHTYMHTYIRNDVPPCPSLAARVRFVKGRGFVSEGASRDAAADAAPTGETMNTTTG